MILCNSDTEKIYHGKWYNKDRDYAMKNMRDNGCTYKEIAKCFGISRQRAHKIVEQVTVNQRNGFY